MSNPSTGSGFVVDESTKTAAGAATADMPDGGPSAGPMPNGTDADHNGHDVGAGAERDGKTGPCWQHTARAGDDLPQRVVQYHQRHHAAGAADDAILASILIKLRAQPVEEMRHALFKITSVLLTTCGYGRKTVAAAISLLDPDIDGAKLVTDVRQWMEKREAKHREEVGDEEFWANAFAPKRRGGRGPNEEI